jgi:hypothetical protein
MAVAGGLDLHRGQLTFDYVDTGTGESWRGRISPADRESLRGWLRRFHGVPDVEFAVEGCTGWRYVVEELQRAGITPHLAEPLVLRWALYEAALYASRPASPDYTYYCSVRDRIDGQRALLSVARKLARRCYHTLRDLGEDALAPAA